MLDDNKDFDTQEAKPSSATIHTLGDLREFIAEHPALSEGERSQLRSAVKRTDEIVGHGALDLAADPKHVLPKLEAYSAAMLEIEEQAFRNLKSRARKAFRLARPWLKSKNANVCLKGTYKALYDQLSERQRRQLSRFLRYAQEAGWHLEDVSDAHIERFGAHLEEQVISRADKILRATVKTWNAAAEAIPDWPDTRLTPIPPRRTPYWLPLTDFPESFQQDVDAYLQRLAEPRGRFGPGRRKPASGTVKAHRNSIVTLASALVHDAMPREDLVDLSSLVDFENLDRAFVWLHARHEGVVTSRFISLCAHARAIAKYWVKVPEKQLTQIEALYQEVKDYAPERRGFAPKNQELHDRIWNDTRFRDELLLLPSRLKGFAESGVSEKLAKSAARDALAIELFLVTGLRRENVIELKLEETIRKIGSGKEAIWVIEIAAEDIKNEEPHYFELTGETADLLEWYLENWRPMLCKTPSPWLFPDKKGEHIEGGPMWQRVTTQTERYLGTAISPHRLRALSAQIFIDEGGSLEATSHHLGHTTPTTTYRSYGRPRQRQASREYGEIFMRSREQARKGKRRKPRPKRSDPSAEQEIEEL